MGSFFQVSVVGDGCVESRKTRQDLADGANGVGLSLEVRPVSSKGAKGASWIVVVDCGYWTGVRAKLTKVLQGTEREGWSRSAGAGDRALYIQT